ncbi:MAG: hypothetical protein E7641_06905 [Ruminococcaceae bacterium]|nr:hypothetical protein [Oscillospiraceae bacterium]
MKKNITVLFCFLLVSIFCFSFSAFSASAENGDIPVSHGLYLLAEDSSMAMAGIKGGRISFDAEDFARAMNLSGIGSVTFTEVPPIADGELLVGSTALSKGQTVSGASLSLLSYEPKSSSAGVSYFRFSVDGSPYDVRCNLYMLESVNYAPTLSVASEAALNLSTHKDITLYGTLPTYDPEGDEVTVEVVSYPKKGLLICDKESGSYTYTPYDGYTGKDSFTYVARDIYGNYSASRTVNLNVKKQSTSTVYADMLSSPYYNAALEVTEAGIMSGESVGTALHFNPEGSVSRVEFLKMAMSALGIEEVASADSTVFSDDADIPKEMKGYVKTAYDLGYIKGMYLDGELCFMPNKEISRAEAAVMICNMIDAATPTVTPSFDDYEEIPDYAVSAVISLNYMGVLYPEEGNISASAQLCRGDAARMLAAVMKSVE